MNILTYKNIFLLFAFFALALQPVTAQKSDDVCGDTTTAERASFYSSLAPQLEKFENEFLNTKAYRGLAAPTINSIPIKAHVIRNSNGTGGICLADINQAIDNLNNVYADAYLEFFLCDGVNYIDQDLLCQLKKGDEQTLIETYYTSGLINIYFTEYIVNNSEESICGYTENTGKIDIIVIKNDCATNPSSLAHEMGHYFSLLHTQGNSTNHTDELVDGSNCDTTGDGICDTPADPGLNSENMDYGCNYIGTERDANGDLYNPDTGNIMSYASKVCRTHFSQQQLARMYAFYMTAKNYLSCPSFNADITANETETCNSSLTVNFESTSPNVTTWQWDVDSDGVIDYTTPNPSHTFETGIYDVTLTVANKSKSVTKVFSNLIKVGTQTEFLDEDFEGFSLLDKHGWSSNDINGNGFSWFTAIGETPSDNTGPSTYNSETGTPNSFMFTEASNGNQGDVAELTSPCFNVDYENSEIEFAYHMYGKNIGELHVDIKTDNGYINDVIAPLIGSQQNSETDAFKTANIDLSAYAYQTIKVRFRAIRGFGWNGDIAIDDVFFKTIHTAITDNNIYKVYPNPVTNNLLYLKNLVPSKTATFTINNLTGQSLISGTVNNNQPIDLSRLPSGNYIISIYNGENRVIKRIIK